MDTPSTAKAIAGSLKAATLAAERERSPVLAAAYDATTGANAALQSANTALAEEKANLQSANTALQSANTALAQDKAALIAAAKALTDALAADNATIAGCATEIAALTALYPAAETT